MICVHRAGVSCKVVVRDEALRRTPGAADCCVIVSGIGIPELASQGGAVSLAVKCSAIVSTDFAEVAAAFSIGGHAIENGASLVRIPAPLVVEEEESFVLKNGAADGSTKIIVTQAGNGNS